MLALWYAQTLNFGEHIGSHILNYLNISWVNYYASNEPSECILIIGSELNKRHIEYLFNKRKNINRIIVWGQGRTDGEYFDCKKNNNIDICLVRGSVTRDFLNLPSETPIGDPGFVLPKIYPIKKNTTDRVLYMPHFNNKGRLEEKKQHLKYTEYMDIFIDKNKFVSTLETIVNSEFVITSSLHVSITCLAYKVPFMIYVDDKEELNRPEKWRDVFEDINIEYKICKTLEHGKIWWDENVKGKKIPSPDEILDTFPKELLLKYRKK